MLIVNEDYARNQLADNSPSKTMRSSNHLDLEFPENDLSGWADYNVHSMSKNQNILHKYSSLPKRKKTPNNRRIILTEE